MILERLVVGPLASNCYIVGSEVTREGMVVDPGDEAEQILSKINDLQLDIKLIVLTHGHVDHIGAVKDVCICLLGHGVVFTGDTLFKYGIGRTDLLGGSQHQLLTSLHTKLMVLPDNTIVYPGHGPESTIGTERSGNPYLRS